MRRVVLAAGLVALGSVAMAGVNPMSAGLPSFNVSNGRGYGTGAMVSPGMTAGARGNGGSSMCVECHSVNPSEHIVAPSGTGVPTGPGNPQHWGSHTVLNSLTNTAFATYTNSGGGGTGFRTTRNGGEYMAKAAWSTGAFSKYNTAGVGIAGPLVSTNGNAVSDWAAADMICESCHNILRNAGSPYVVGAYTDAVGGAVDTLCVVCHDGGADNTGDYATWHANGNMQNFNRTARKRHHVMIGEPLTLANYNPDGNNTTNDSVMWAPSFSDKLLNSWCTAPYTAGNPASLPYGTPAAFRDACNVSGVGTRAATALNTGADMPLASGNNISCISCHRPHNARSSSGAFIFRMGGTNANFPGGAGTSGTTVDTIGYGIRRQSDTGDFAAVKVYGEYVTLCNGCHRGYGQ